MSEVGSFWARRRAAVRAEEEAQAHAAEAAREAEQAAELEQKDDETILAELGLPHPDNLKAGDDFSAFMAREVPERLRRQALRTLWRSNPVLACVDGLNDYDDDFRAAAMNQGPIKTAYQVGKGMLSHIEEMARQAEAAEVPKTDETTVATSMDDAAPPSDASPQPAEAKVEARLDLAPDAESDPETTPAPRRMRFRFDEASV